ncbi:MAG: hypothetical protein ACU84Q_14850 [Gammaproteobacteria bacterium]
MRNAGLIGFVIIFVSTGWWFWRAWAVNLPKTPYLFQSFLVLGFILGCMSIFQGAEDPFAGWAIGLSIVFIYLTATGAQKIGVDSVKVGDRIPAFTAPDDHDANFDSASLAGSRVLLKFFRGHW